jgi:hypothetical protein
MRKILSLFAIGLASTALAFGAAGLGDATDAMPKRCASQGACSCSCGGDKSACTCPAGCLCDNCGAACCGTK